MSTRHFKIIFFIAIAIGSWQSNELIIRKMDVKWNSLQVSVQGGHDNTVSNNNLAHVQSH